MIPNDFMEGALERMGLSEQIEPMTKIKELFESDSDLTFFKQVYSKIPVSPSKFMKIKFQPEDSLIAIKCSTAINSAINNWLSFLTAKTFLLNSPVTFLKIYKESCVKHSVEEISDTLRSKCLIPLYIYANKNKYMNMKLNIIFYRTVRGMFNISSKEQECARFSFNQYFDRDEGATAKVLTLKVLLDADWLVEAFYDKGTQSCFGKDDFLMLIKDKIGEGIPTTITYEGESLSKVAYDNLKSTFYNYVKYIKYFGYAGNRL